MMLKKIFLIGILLISCSKKEPILTKEDMLKLAPFEGPDKVSITMARNINDAIPCSDYGEGCLSAHRLRARELDFIGVEFMTGAQAAAASRRVHGWMVKNWLFDDVEGEPRLEDWVTEYFKAQRYAPKEKKLE